MNVVFRTDSSLDIGTGHLMRCLTLADALHEFGARSRFVCRAHRGNLCDLVRQRGHDVSVLPLDEAFLGPKSVKGERAPVHAAWLGTEWETDAAQTLSVLSGMAVDWLVVDHYALDASWEGTLRPACGHLMVIDDLADRSHDCDLLLDQNLGRGPANYRSHVPADCTVLAGPKYALLRPEFAALRSYSIARRGNPQLKHLLVTMGGVDKSDATGKVLEALKDCLLPADCRVTVVMGLHAPWIASVKDQATNMPWRTDVLVGVPGMARLMANSDLAIGAAGSTLWEFCTLGLPTLVAILAENQRHAGLELAVSGAAKIMSNESAFVTSLQQIFQEMSRDISALSVMSDRATKICDGQGAIRVAEKLLFLNN